MLVFDGLGGLLVLGLWIFCFVDVLLTPEGACRTLPKLAWVFIVLLLPFVGPIAWLIAGRPWGSTLQRMSQPAGSVRRDRSARAVPTNPDDDEEFLAVLSKRAEEQRRRAREQQDREGREGDLS